MSAPSPPAPASAPSGGNTATRTVLVLNGPNLNLLGKRQPQIYGHATLADVEAECRRVGAELGFGIAFHQSNREYEIIDWIHEWRETAAGIIINPYVSGVAAGIIAGCGNQGYTLALQRLSRLISEVST